MFKPLTKDNIAGILKILLADINRRLKEKEIVVELTDAAVDYVAEHAYEPAFGARPLKRYLGKHVETLLARKILADEVSMGETVVIDANDTGLIVKASE